jgi:hypothetical protein
MLGRLVEVYGLCMFCNEYYRMKERKIMHANIGKFCKRNIRP